MSDERTGAGQRSPSYPQYGLGRAIELVRLVYEGAHRAEIGNEAVASLMGYKSLSGPATAAIGALKQFGLLEGRDPKIHITPLALSILEPLDEGERRRSLLAAARTPSVFNDLIAEFGAKRPAENVLRSIAIRRYQFSGSGGDRFVSTYLETIGLLENERAFDSVSKEVAVREETGISPTGPSGPGSIEKTVATAESEVMEGERLEFRLSPESRAVIVFSGQITQQSIEKLAAILQVVKDTYPTE